MEEEEVEEAEEEEEIVGTASGAAEWCVTLMNMRTGRDKELVILKLPGAGTPSSFATLREKPVSGCTTASGFGLGLRFRC